MSASDLKDLKLLGIGILHICVGVVYICVHFVLSDVALFGYGLVCLHARLLSALLRLSHLGTLFLQILIANNSANVLLLCPGGDIRCRDMGVAARVHLFVHTTSRFGMFIRCIAVLLGIMGSLLCLLLRTGSLFYLFAFVYLRIVVCNLSNHSLDSSFHLLTDTNVMRIGTVGSRHD